MLTTADSAFRRHGGPFSFVRRMDPTHGLTLFFLLGLIFLVLIVHHQLPLWRSLLLRYALWIGLLFALRLSAGRKEISTLGGVANDFSPILFVVLIYQSLGDLIQYLQPDIDPTLVKIDFFLFGVHPTVWMERWIVPWLTDLLSIAYGSYYFLPASLVLVLYLSGRKEEFRLSVFVLLFGYYLSFIGYILFPAIGPRYTLVNLQSVPWRGVW